MTRISLICLLALVLLASAAVLSYQINTQLSERQLAQAHLFENRNEVPSRTPVPSRGYAVQGATPEHTDQLRLDFNF